MTSTTAADLVKTQSKVGKVRISNPCDGCTIRRVRCEAQRPCQECRKRGIPCTNLRTRQKRGPKGPREETSRKVLEFQKKYAEEHDPRKAAGREAPPTTACEDGGSHGSTDVSMRPAALKDTLPIHTPPTEVAPSSSSAPSSVAPSSLAVRSRHLPLESYTTYLELFRDRLQCIWPVIDYDGLIEKLQDDNDHESYAFAASVCAGTLVQLRLAENLSEQKRVLAQRFAQDARAIRNNFDYLEEISMPSLLTSYLLHMYYVNCGMVRTAGFYMRETITYVQTMQLDRSETYDYMDPQERSLKLRVYWLVLITERTYCAHSRIPIILPTIDKHPLVDDTRVRHDILQAFGSLVGLFACLRANITEVATVPSTEVFDLKRLMRYQSDLAVDPRHPNIQETQYVNISVTRQWIRLLIWEYTVRHFPMPYQSDVPGYALTFPVPVARELLETLTSAHSDSIVCHGHGLELKVSRVADLLLDIMSLSPLCRAQQTMLVGAEDVVSSLSDLLFRVGGPSSPFAKQTKMRLGELMASQASVTRTQLLLPSEEGIGGQTDSAQEASEQSRLDATDLDQMAPGHAHLFSQGPGMEWMFDAPVDPTLPTSGVRDDAITDPLLESFLTMQ